MSGFLFFLLAGLCILIASALIFVVIIQNSKGGGLSSAFGASGASQILGARRSNEFIEKLTWYLAGALAVVAFLANVMGSTATTAADPTLDMMRVLDHTEAYGDEGPTELPTFDATPTPTPAPAAEEEGE